MASVSNGLGSTGESFGSAHNGILSVSCHRSHGSSETSCVIICDEIFAGLISPESNSENYFSDAFCESNHGRSGKFVFSFFFYP